jgi:hypothetical protein
LNLLDAGSEGLFLFFISGGGHILAAERSQAWIW